MKIIEDQTEYNGRKCVQFKEINSTEDILAKDAYVSVVPFDGFCEANVGFQKRGQLMRLDKKSMYYFAYAISKLINQLTILSLQDISRRQ